MRESVTLTNMTRRWAVSQCCLQSWESGNWKLASPRHWNLTSERGQYEAEDLEEPEESLLKIHSQTQNYLDSDVSLGQQYTQEGSNLEEIFTSPLIFITPQCQPATNGTSYILRVTDARPSLKESPQTHLKMGLTTFQSKRTSLMLWQTK